MGACVYLSIAFFSTSFFFLRASADAPAAAKLYFARKRIDYSAHPTLSLSLFPSRSLWLELQQRVAAAALEVK